MTCSYHWRLLASKLAAQAVLLFALPAAGQDLSPVEQLGKSIFFDANLSANGTQACSSCHDPARGFTSPHDHFNEKGAIVEGALAGRFGNRKPPSAAYAAVSPAFHHILDEGAVTFVGGAFLDGRATGGRLGRPTADQAQGPFLNPLEMALPHQACVVQRICNPHDKAAYPVAMADVWGADICAIPLPESLATDCANPDALVTIGDKAQLAAIDQAFDRIALSIAAYEQSGEVMRFSARYDRWLAGKAQLSPDELTGLALFKAEDKGNCAACHVLGPNTLGGPSVLTDWTFDNLGVPRNRDNPFYLNAKANPDGKGWIDPGLGGTLKKDPVYAPYAKENWARQQVPTLRNLTKGAAPGVARAYMHNGYFKTLEGVVHFYNTRDRLPRCADSMATEAEAMAIGCWPAPEYEATMNRDELGNLKLTAKEEAQIVAFLRTLDDE
ncbi:MAG: hypothetical protein ORN49_13825 [Rhodobacteraceae bacterium]|nr:hypothetical protein [Paracoccaceae bacterium]